MHFHLIGVCGTGMGSLAGLLVAAGHRVTGSDVAFHPPMGDALVRWGVETRAGWNPENLEPAPDRVVVGNVCRPDNPEARAALDRGLDVVSLPGAMAELFLADRPSYVVAGSHGKTTTTSLLAHLLHDGSRDPGLLAGGIARNFDASFRMGRRDAPFVIEGDEYDSAFFEKTPKFWHYRPDVAIITSIEHDHIDIYPDADSYRAAFEGLVERLPPDGLLVAWAGSPTIRAVASRARCRVSWFALDGEDWGDAMPVWLGGPVAVQGGAQPFDLFFGGTFCGRAFAPIIGHHNIRNALAAMAVAAEAEGIPVSQLVTSLPRFAGARRRQELLGVADGVHVYDDFAHHPTEVRETLRGLRAKHPEGQLIAVFEPRSATACRALHQDAYGRAFAPADLALLAPVARSEVGPDERLDRHAIVTQIAERGRRAQAADGIDPIVERIVEEARPGDAVVVMSNGPFEGIHDRILVGLTARRLQG